MEIFSTLIAAIPALATIGALVFLLHLIQAQRQLYRDHETHLENRLDDSRKELDEARNALKYFGSLDRQAPALSNSALSPEAKNSARSKKRLFISTPVRGFDDADFSGFVEEVSRMIDGMNATRRFDGIFYENYRFASKEVFEARRLPVNEYFAELERADVFVAIVPMASLSSVYFEAGYAASLGKPSVYFIPEGARKVMPSLMGEADRLWDNVSIVTFDSLDHVQRVLAQEFGDS